MFFGFEIICFLNFIINIYKRDDLVVVIPESIMSNHRNRSELRYATRTMVMITFTYLLCNIFNVIITVMENVFKNNNVMFNDDGSR